MTDRDAFMTRIRASLGRSATPSHVPAPPEVDGTPARLATANDPIVDMFAVNAEAVGMHVTRCGEADLQKTVSDTLRACGAKRIALGGGVPVDDAFEQIDWRAAGGLDAMYDVDAGVTDVQVGIAETGTLALHCDAQGGRSLSLVPPVHVAVLRAGDIVPDMLDYWAAMQHMPGSVALITGPSKTADIEGELIQGVHGPGEVFIILVV